MKVNKQIDWSKGLSIMAIVAIISSLIFTGSNFFFHSVIIDKISVSGFILFSLPFLALQFCMSAGICASDFGYKGVPKAFFWLFFLIIFPLTVGIFFNGINFLFHIIEVLRFTEAYAGDTGMKTWQHIAAIYAIITLSGLFWRLIKAKEEEKEATVA